VVVVDDPLKTRAYAYLLDAEGVEEARSRAARASIVEDPRGVGVSDGDATYPLALRQRWSRDPEMVAAVAAYARATAVPEVRSL